MQYFLKLAGPRAHGTWLATLLGAALFSTAGYAQDAEGVPTRLAGSDDREEITVSARRRDESLQDVPISITAFTGDTLQDRGITDAYDIANNTPNFSFTPNLGRRLDVPNIRGQFGPLIGGTAPNASFFVDGVFVAGSIGSTNTSNLERVEVLRGPQSALFGRATFSGAVNYITRSATNEFEGQANALIGEDQRRQAGGWASGPIIKDKLLFFAGVNYTSWDGEWRNGLQPGQVNSATQAGPFGSFVWRNNRQLPGDPACPPGSVAPVGDPPGSPPGCAPTVGDNTRLGGEETKTGTFKLNFTPTDALDITVKYERSEADDDHFAYFFVPPNERNNCFNRGTDGVALDPRAGSRSGGWICGPLENSNYTSVLNLPNFKRGVTVNPPGSPPEGFFAPPAPFLGLEEEVDRYLADVSYVFNDYELTARYAGEDRTSQFVRDLDRSYALGPAATGLFEGYELQEDKLDTLEFKIASPVDSEFRWFVGYYYYDQDSAGFARDFTGFSRINLVSTGTNQVENRALFGSLSYDIIDTLTVDFEWRYAEDTISRQAQAIGTNETIADVSETFYNFSPRGIIKWQMTDDLSTYFSVAQGNKPGGFNFAFFDADADPNELIAKADKTTIKEENAWTWEVGAKGQFFDNRLIANAAVFYIDWTNQAINVQECIETIDPNAPCELNNIVANAGESRVYGLELEGTYFATDSLSFTFGYGYTDSELEDFKDEETAFLLCPEECYETVGGGSDELTPAALALRNQLGDVKGNKAPLVPKHSFNLNSNYQRAISSTTEVFFRNNWTFESKRFSTVNNFAYAPSRWQWDSRVGLETASWTIFAYVRNLTDEKSPVQIQDFPLFDAAAGYLGPGGAVNQNAFTILPRQSRNFGIQGQFRFGRAAQ